MGMRGGVSDAVEGESWIRKGGRNNERESKGDEDSVKCEDRMIMGVQQFNYEVDIVV